MALLGVIFDWMKQILVLYSGHMRNQKPFIFAICFYLYLLTSFPLFVYLFLFLFLLLSPLQREGFALPDLKLYYEAACLCWMKEWVELKNANNADLEGFNLSFGWHAYLYYGKTKLHKGFLNHIIRKNLCSVLARHKDLLERKTLDWISPTGAVAVKKVNLDKNCGTYKDLLNFKRF